MLPTYGRIDIASSTLWRGLSVHSSIRCFPLLTWLSETKPNTRVRDIDWYFTLKDGCVSRDIEQIDAFKQKVLTLIGNQAATGDDYVRLVAEAKFKHFPTAVDPSITRAACTEFLLAAQQDTDEFRFRHF